MGILPLFLMIMEIKDRIRVLMEEQHMTQQVFAEFLEQSPATLSSIFNGRTSPTLKIVDAIKMKIPDINIEWLLYGTGEVHIPHPESGQQDLFNPSVNPQEQMINFESNTPSVTPSGPYPSNSVPPTAGFGYGVKTTHPEFPREEIKNVDKQPRRVTEIRVYYDDQTYETFIPAKK